ncbi:uncharacterized protein N7518_005408 [Penicillium psychrosexuale]|uniref:uncharacterized protein n=1 Tax=Penicillium psychrosexuale TaxID=1002107 RepID=UPI002545B2CE|nr:uncharacterized protein N7518_005408 [Penicillium psychrosexuale]KAJ5796868.1 hypothetical protein N7518_005408 [Penicillium psychrosexuale]
MRSVKLEGNKFSNRRWSVSYLRRGAVGRPPPYKLNKGHVKEKKIGSFSLIERVILSAGAMLIFSVYFHLTICPEGRKSILKVQYKLTFRQKLTAYYIRWVCYITLSHWVRYYLVFPILTLPLQSVGISKLSKCISQSALITRRSQ